jgi:hypothetical protein
MRFNLRTALDSAPYYIETSEEGMILFFYNKPINIPWNSIQRVEQFYSPLMKWIISSLTVGRDKNKCMVGVRVVMNDSSERKAMLIHARMVRNLLINASDIPDKAFHPYKDLQEFTTLIIGSSPNAMVKHYPGFYMLFLTSTPPFP